MITYDPIFANSAIIQYFHTRDTILTERGFSSPLSACCFSACGLDLPAFANLSDTTNARENDFFNFTQSVPTGYSIIATLLDLKTGDEYVISDDTYGIFEDIGNVVDRPNVWGFVVEWHKVANALDFGKYQFRFQTRNSVGTFVGDELSACFHLDSFDCESAHKTVRISVAQSGSIGGRFDWRDIEGNLSTSAGIKVTRNNKFGNYQIRLRGKLERTGEIAEADFISDTTRKSSLVQKLTFSSWTLKLNWVKFIISDVLLKEMFLANPIVVDDYNIDNVTTYNNIKLTHLSNDDIEKFDGLKDEFFTINLEDHQKNNIKRYNT